LSGEWAYHLKGNELLGLEVEGAVGADRLQATAMDMWENAL